MMGKPIMVIGTLARFQAGRSPLLSSRCKISPTGAAEIAEYVRGSAVVKHLSVAYNEIDGEVAQQLATAVLSSKSLEVFTKIPIKELRTDTLTELDLNDRGVGVSGALVLAELVKFSAVLTALNLQLNMLDDAAKQSVHDAVAGRDGFVLGLSVEPEPNRATGGAGTCTVELVLKKLDLRANDLRGAEQMVWVCVYSWT